MNITDACTLLTAVREHLDTRAIIAGGYARDMYLGVPSKDVDIWLCSGYEPEDAEEVLRHVLGDRLLTLNLYAASKHPEYFAGLRWIIKATLRDGNVIDVIELYDEIMDGAHNVLATFDFWLCSIALDVDSAGNLRGYFKHPFFDLDVRDKVITFNNCGRGVEDLARVFKQHLPRLQAKFPDFKTQGVPDEYTTVGAE